LAPGPDPEPGSDPIRPLQARANTPAQTTSRERRSFRRLGSAGVPRIADLRAVSFQHGSLRPRTRESAKNGSNARWNAISTELSAESHSVSVGIRCIVGANTVHSWPLGPQLVAFGAATCGLWGPDPKGSRLMSPREYLGRRAVFDRCGVVDAQRTIRREPDPHGDRVFVVEVVR
jgi:hypothetical protein